MGGNVGALCGMTHDPTLADPTKEPLRRGDEEDSDINIEEVAPLNDNSPQRMSDQATPTSSNTDIEDEGPDLREMIEDLTKSSYGQWIESTKKDKDVLINETVDDNELLSDKKFRDFIIAITQHKISYFELEMVMSNWKGHCGDLMDYMKSKWQWCEERMKGHENEVRYESLKEQYECGQTKNVDWKGVTKQAKPRVRKGGNCEDVVAQFVTKTRLSEQEMATCRRAVMLWRWLDTTHGVHTLHDVFESKRQLCLITSALEGGDLLHYITSDSIRSLWNEAAIATLFAQILTALNGMHEKGIVHCNLQPEHIMMDKSTWGAKAHIANLERAMPWPLGIRTPLHVHSNAPAYGGYVECAAPELVSRSKKKVDLMQADMWSSGCILFLLLCGHFPFFVNANHSIVSLDISQWVDKNEYWQTHVSAEARDLVKSLLCRNGSDRLTAQQALGHPWIIAATAATTTVTLKTKTMPDVYWHELRKTQIKRKLQRGMQLLLTVDQLARLFDPDVNPSFEWDRTLPSDTQLQQYASTGQSTRVCLPHLLEPISLKQLTNEESEPEEDTPCVIDNGSGMMKAGFAGEANPRAVFPSVVARQKQTSFGSPTNKIYVGDDVHEKRGILSLKYPIEHGLITDWDEMEMIWNHIFQDELKIDPKNHGMFLTEPPLNPIQNREKMIQVMFERFEVPKAYVAIQALLSLFANGKTTGIVCDSGDAVSHAVPIYDGCCLPQGVLRLNLGGRDLTDYMQRLLQETGNSFTTTAEKDMLRTLKEELCYIALNYNEELAKSQQHSHEILQSFTLPDERIIHVNSERFKCPEVLFKPHWVGIEQKGIHHLVNDSIIKCRDVDIAQDLYKNIVLSGGTTMLKGFAARLTCEIQSLVPTSVSLHVLAPENRKYSVWIGGSILASLTSFQEQWISNSEYKEFGSSIVHRKCN